MDERGSFHGKTALITGASRGIGRATALLLAQRGADVVVHYKSAKEEADAVARTVVGSGGRALVARADLEQSEEIAALFDEVRRTFGHLDIFVANAAATAFRAFTALKPHHLARTYQITVFAFVQAAQEAMRLMAGRRGKIVTVSSFPTERYLPDYALLGSAKAALEALTRYLAVEAAPLGITVNGVSPGVVDTGSTQTYARDDAERFVQAMVASTPRGRLGTPEDIARVIAFLCSEDAEWIIGQTIVVDGGLTLPTPYFPRGRLQP